MEHKTQRCDFCSQTSRPGLAMYKGDLSAMICSDCVKAVMLMAVDHSVQIGAVRKEAVDREG